MSERRRPKLYKKDDKDDEDVLKKLKEVRQNLQESLDDDKPPGPKPVRKRGDRKLYKKEQVDAIKKPVKKRPLTDTVSKRRLATVQKRVKSKIEESRGISKKKKGLIISG